MSKIDRQWLTLLREGLATLWAKGVTFGYRRVLWPLSFLSAWVSARCIYRLIHSEEPEESALAVSRREHYIYWEMSRRARGLPTTFQYYEWDQNSNKIIKTDRQGRQTMLTLNPDRDVGGGLALERVIAREAKTGLKLDKEKAIAMAYSLNRKNKYDLRNYLCHKPYTPGDLLRCAYYLLYVELGITNKFRYDQFLSKPDSVYDFEKLRMAVGPERPGRMTRKLKEIALYQRLDKQFWPPGLSLLSSLRDFVFWNYL